MENHGGDLATYGKTGSATLGKFSGWTETLFKEIAYRTADFRDASNVAKTVALFPPMLSS